MKFFFNKQAKSEFKAGRKLVVFLLVFSILAVFPLSNVSAQLVTAEAASVPQTVKMALDKIWQASSKLLQKAGSIAFNRALSSALNKIAYDSANYIGSGGKGQKPLFITKGLGDYLTQIGDEAAGQFIESFVNNLNAPSDNTCSQQLETCRKKCLPFENKSTYGDNSAFFSTDCLTVCDKEATACAARSQTTADQVTPSFNVCSPSSLDVKVKIGLGLVEQTRPQAPNCAASEMIKSWGDSIDKKLASLRDPNYLDEFVNIFDPRSNDVGILVAAQTDLTKKQLTVVDTKKSEFITNKGWTDVRAISGALKGVPGSSQKTADDAADARKQALGKTTGDILVDASNVFLNQLYFSAFQNLLQTLGEKTSKAGKSESTPGDSGNYEGDPNAYGGETNLKEITTKLLQANFGVRADYDILSELSVCLDPKNPAPTNCVIDDKFMQGITEKKTVGEALKEGYLHGDWQLTKDNRAGSYNLRNISILRKYRILPVGWEEAVAETYADVTAPRKANLADYVSCFDPFDQYNEFSSEFDTNNTDWCLGLIDPNWVLKAPLNYCGKEGFGAQIISTQVIPGSKGISGADDTPSELVISRADAYCADSQTCIKEKSDGSCDAYGYCNEERRTWVFGSDSCQPVNNTCQDFTNIDSGASAAYLENTLDYSNCNSENSGCRQYSYSGIYSTSTNSVAWSGAVKGLYLNKNVKDCDNTSAGCTELMRLKPTWGANLVMDADFGNETIGNTALAPALNGWPISNSKLTVVDSAVEPGNSGGKALRIETKSTAAGVYSNFANSLLPTGFRTVFGQAYTLSADLYLSDGDNVSLGLGELSDGFVKSVADKNLWQHVSVTRVAGDGYADASFFISGFSADGTAVFYLKNLKFEISGWDTGYSAYGRFKVYEKLLPSYLGSSCYVDVFSSTKDYSLKNDAPAVCSDFARRCNKEEAGCELYSSGADNFSVPAKVVNSDYCSDQCLGYDVYVAKADQFNPASAENLIPSTATVCSAAEAGCSEFTNLDALASGGEQKEYYTSLKQCVKPSPAVCSAFYSWEGADNGYQLKSYYLKKTAAGLPAVSADDSDLCNAEIYNLPVGDSRYNPDCREFYNAAGQADYHLTSRTITCSDDCHSYRLSGNRTEAECLNGGVWDAEQKACVYQAIPGEGQTCEAKDNGCREYNGNSGNNVRLVTSYDFESGLPAFWTSNCAAGLSVSTIANNNNGHSLKYSDAAGNCGLVGEDAGAPVSKVRLIERILASDNVAAQLAVGNSVVQDRAYIVKFLARASANTDLKMYFLNKETKAKAYFNASAPLVIKGGDQWNLYQISLDELDHVVSPNERLIITASADFLFDDFVLSEITDRYYLINRSSVIPDVCYYDIFDQYRGTDYNLGCAQYTDRGGLKHNLRQFSDLCSDSAVGCEQLIDTKNYSPYQSGIWNDTNQNGTCDAAEPDCVSVPEDQAIYAVYDPGKLCSAAGKGCSRLGQGQGGLPVTSWVDVFKLNNPDTYNQTLCQKTGVGCEAWQNGDGSGVSYFKNPGLSVCSYRASGDPRIFGKKWYQVAVKRCDINNDNVIQKTQEGGGSICTGDTDCGTHKCLIDNNDYECSVSPYKTIGLGGKDNQVWIPDTAAGLCDANESGCTEYIDPVSQFSANLVFNPGYQMINGQKEGWGFVGDEFIGQQPTPTQQIIRLEPNKLYSFTVKTDLPGDSSLSFVSGVKPLLADNNFGTTTNNLMISADADRPVIFNSLDNLTALLDGGAVGRTIEIKELVVDYQLEANVDKKSCNGLVNFDNGCVLFNERGVSGSAGMADLTKGWDAYKTDSGKTPTACSPAIAGSCTTNQLVKVRPDRVCSKWLDCVSYVDDPASKEKTCYAVAECNRLDDKNECANFVDVATSTRSFDFNNDKNATGYSLLNKYHLSQAREVGASPVTAYHLDFENGSSLTCRGDINFPDGSVNCPPADSPKPAYDFVDEPAEAPTDYPAEGKSYLKVLAPYQVSNEVGDTFISLISPSTGKTNAYYLNYMVNTRDSNLRTKVIITDKDNAVIKDAVTGESMIFYASAPGGWETKVAKLNIGPGKNNIKIYLTSDTTSLNDKQYVYFDNLNIEPVLEVGNDQYAVRECRLYPTDDSPACKTKYNNVIQNGLEGYCLEHDSFNPNVCLLWYPVDKISTTRLSRESAYGYKGAYPLNYCSEVNGNFDIVENKTAYLLGSLDTDIGNDHECPGQGKQNGFHPKTCPASIGDCPDGYDAFYYEYAYDDNGSLWNCNGDCWCVPKTNLAQLAQISVRWNHGTTEGSSGVFSTTAVPAAGYVMLVASSSNSVIFGADRTGAKQDKEDTHYHSELTTFVDGWYKYDGLSTAGAGQILADPSVRVYDYGDSPTTEAGLKFVSINEGDDVGSLFRLTCNKFVEVVDGNGGNKAWSARINGDFSSGDYSTTTPLFFVTDANNWYGNSPYSLAYYGLNRDFMPFGAAVLPSDLTSVTNRVNLRDPYSASATLFAGRPYGCDKGNSVNGCSSIGYCSNSKDTYCLTTKNFSDGAVSGLCPSGGGTCVPLWAEALSPASTLPYDYKNILKSIFISSTKSYDFNGTMYAIDDGSFYNFTSNLNPCTGNKRQGVGGSSFCWVKPIISNIKLYYGGTKTEIPIPEGTFNIATKGVYRLEFNSEVDKDQQPLKKIFIDWGDGSSQTVTDEDHQPDSNKPHVFYHYYSYKGSRSLQLEITDNWGYWDKFE